MLAIGNLNMGIPENATPTERGTAWAKAPKTNAAERRIAAGGPITV